MREDELLPVTRWLAEQGIPFEGLGQATLLAGGRSNLTYRIEDEAARNYVLRRPPIAERQLIEDCIQKSMEAVPQMLSGQLDKAMMKLHAKPPRPKPPKPESPPTPKETAP